MAFALPLAHVQPAAGQTNPAYVPPAPAQTPAPVPGQTAPLFPATPAPTSDAQAAPGADLPPPATVAPSVTPASPPAPVLPQAPAVPLADPAPPSLLSEPTADPLRIDPSTDPILRLAHSQASPAAFRTAVSSAVERHPATQESEATTDEVRAVLAEAHERRLPSVDLSVSSYRVIDREFSNDPNNIVERSRATNRTDAQLSIQQTVLDFGASAARVAAAGARLRAAAAEAEATADRIALATVAAWYDVFAFRALVAVTESFVANQEELRDAVEERIRQGVSAQGDTARVESYLASAQTRLARFRRLLASAESRFTELTGYAPPPTLERAPVAALPALTRDAAALAAMRTPAARSAQAMADSARQEAKAARSDRLPQVTAGIDAGRYGVFETDKDYDIRGRVTMRQRLFGGTEARLSQYEARARAADARATRIREEAARDAAIAWSDVRALEEQVEALEASYIASRRSRDVLIERFVNARGDLFDVVAAEDAYFETATAYIQALSELDAARYVLLSRTGGLLDTLGIEPGEIGGRFD